MGYPSLSKWHKYQRGGTIPRHGRLLKHFYIVCHSYVFVQGTRTLCTKQMLCAGIKYSTRTALALSLLH
ncbi:hypothetical protein XENTR_v10001769 [Xenopus tropicalis]|nr:hypothetical protein XENTR_v10001769 [Xenopus tropicalis]